MTNEIVKRVSVLYEDILQRKPDKTGLYYLVSRINKKLLTIDDAKKIVTRNNRMHL